jgi:23S rRNA A2030 N6-methylase RlmJ
MAQRKIAMSMLLVLNNQAFMVADYPGENAIEVIDKRAGLGGLIRDAAAQRFREGLSKLMEQSPEIEEMDDFIEHYKALLNQPAILH